MAGPSDKARFYLEQSVPELQELERKKIFSKDEISAIAKKRSDFEHIINARGSHPSDYMRYIEFELNLEALRRKRIKRLGVKSTGSGQKRIFFLFNRATRKFSGDLGLWMQYLEFARKEKAYKRLNEIFTAVVRLHPTNPELWTYAARYFMDTQADITNARSYMQRGLRFCKSSRNLWLDYAKLETIYIGKIVGRRKILGIDGNRKTKEADTEDMIALPDITADDINPKLDKEDGVDEVALENLEHAPVLTGAIPIAIFDAAVKEFEDDPALSEQFFDMFAEFHQLPCIDRILRHVVDHLQSNAPSSDEIDICKFHSPLVSVHPTSPEFPGALKSALNVLEESWKQNPIGRDHLLVKATRIILSLMRASDDIDPAIQKVLRASLAKCCRRLEETLTLQESSNTTRVSGDAIFKLVESLYGDAKQEEARLLLEANQKLLGMDDRFTQLQAAIAT